MTIVDANGAGRVFTSDVDISLSDLTVQNGKTNANDGGGSSTLGALTLTNVTVFSNTEAALASSRGEAPMPLGLPS
ncbi:MAG: hypothetical protein IPK16_17890 [Anaerolineales bacterium]|nr:hypothetical protein [Anaerolineales bacterium]